MEQIMERLLAMMEANQGKKDANPETLEAKMDSNQEEMQAKVGSLASRTDTYLEEMNACREATEAWYSKRRPG
jgi:hypothetical protein